MDESREQDESPALPRDTGRGRRILVNAKQIHDTYSRPYMTQRRVAKQQAVSQATIFRRLRVASVDPQPKHLPLPAVVQGRADAVNIAAVELRILAMVASGFSNAAIGTVIRKSTQWVAGKLEEIYPALGAIDRPSAVRRCYEYGLLESSAVQADQPEVSQ